jgi:hypothetical protein
MRQRTSLGSLDPFYIRPVLRRRDCKFRTEDDSTAKTFRSGLGLHSRRLLSGESTTITKLRYDVFNLDGGKTLLRPVLRSNV